jgi:hypothetical protein
MEHDLAKDPASSQAIGYLKKLYDA